MDAQAILVKIEQDAKDAAQKVVEDAQLKAKTLTLEAQQKRDMQKSTIQAQAEQDCIEMEERMQRMADLDNRKAMLALKREVIDDAFALAKDKLNQTKPADRRAFYLRKVATFACGEETLIVGAGDAQWFDESFLNDANQALKAAGKPGNLTLQNEQLEDCSGVVLAYKGAEIRITFDSLLDEARAALEQEAAQSLFND